MDVSAADFLMHIVRTMQIVLSYQQKVISDVSEFAFSETTADFQDLYVFMYVVA